MQTKNKPTDKIKPNNENGFAEIYKQNFNKVFNYFWSRNGQNKQEAEDLTQETFLKALEHTQEYEERNIPYGAYLMKIAHNLLVSFYRKIKPLPIPEDFEVADPKQADAITKNIITQDVWKLAKNLAPMEREVLKLRHQQDLTIKLIAGKIGKTENAVKSILSRAHKQLSNNFSNKK